jgi:hypothetical protein
MGREGKGREGKGREGKGREGKGMEGMEWEERMSGVKRKRNRPKQYPEN